MASRRSRLFSAEHGPGWPPLVILLVGVIVLGAVLFVLVGPLTGSNEEEPHRYVEAVVGSPARINPLFAYSNDVDRDIASLVFSGLTRLGPAGEILPDLAESWEASPDGRNYTFHLRPDVYWQSGVPFSAADVMFTYGLLADPNLPGDPDQAALWRQVKCSVPGELTVRCQLPEPFSPFLSFTTVGILPKHMLEGAAAASLPDHPFNQAPVGTGPFRVVQIDQSHVILKANAAYHLDPPQLDEIELRFYPDTATAAAALARREVQGLLLGPGASQIEFDILTSREGLKAYTARGTAYTVLYLNNGVSPLNDRRVRSAIAQSIDIDALIGNLLEGRAVRAHSPIVPGTWAYNPELEPYPHDLKAARALLEEAGWLLPQGSQTRQREGVELSISLITDRDPLRNALAQEVAQQLAKVGIAVRVTPQDSTTLVRDFLIPRQYQAAIFGWDPGPDPDPYPAWHSSQITDNGRNLAAYVSDEADRLLEEARRTTDMNQRQALYYAFQQIFHDDVPSLLLYYPVYTYFVSDQIKGIKLGTLFYTSSRFGNVREWSWEKSKDIRAP